MDFTKLKTNLKKDFSNLNTHKMAILGDCATQLLAQAIKAIGYDYHLNLEIYEANYNQIDQEIFDRSSDLYKFEAEFFILLHSSQKLLSEFYKLQPEQRAGYADMQLQNFKKLIETLSSHTTRRIIVTNFPEINDSLYGNFANSTVNSFTYQLRKINLGLMEYSQKGKAFYINDVAALQNQHGRSQLFDERNLINYDLPYQLDALPILAKNILDITQAILGSTHKCLILDLDETLWGGIIGDDGIENIQIGDLGIGKAFTHLQLWIKQLKQRGIILVVCSNNDEQIAKEPFLKHPDMVLSLDDIAVFCANRNNKIDNIKHIQKILNIGFDSMVFLDDNPFERNMVKTHLPEITVPDLPEDAAQYLPYLQSCNLFEIASLSDEDQSRTKRYQEEAKRIDTEELFTNVDDYLKSLDMTAKVEPFNKFNSPRVAQLTQRSNQFNLRTVRYNEKDIQKLSSSNDDVTFAFSLSDKFGDHGLISVIVLKKSENCLFIDTWIMSCRVLKRGMENFVLNTLVTFAQKNNFKSIVGEYISTAKNGLVKDHYANLGFAKNDKMWQLNVADFKMKTLMIKANS